jgi:aryl-alcohol dehydrogenase-like predicted oxidoreductase
MGLSNIYGAADDTASIATIHRAIELGVTFFDTADVHGEGHNEELVGRAIPGKRDQLVIASKFGNGLDRERGGRAIDGRPEYARSATEASLRGHPHRPRRPEPAWIDTLRVGRHGSEI